MTLNLDLLVGSLLILSAMCVAAVHLITSPKRKNWLTAPAYFRRSLLVYIVMALWRGVNLASLAHSPTIQAGQMNPEGAMMMLALLGMVFSGTAWALTHVMPDRAWERVQWALGEMRRRPGQTPLLVPDSEVTQIARATGQATLGPAAGPQDVAAEVPRFVAAVRRKHP